MFHYMQIPCLVKWIKDIGYAIASMVSALLWWCTLYTAQSQFRCTGSLQSVLNNYVNFLIMNFSNQFVFVICGFLYDWYFPVALHFYLDWKLKWITCFMVLHWFQVTYTANIMIFCVSLNMVAFLQKATICFLVIMLTVESSH